MDRWTGRVALVTGASAGLGAALAKTLASKGLKVVACARRIEKLQELASECKFKLSQLQTSILIVHCRSRSISIPM